MRHHDGDRREELPVDGRRCGIRINLARADLNRLLVDLRQGRGAEMTNDLVKEALASALSMNEQGCLFAAARLF